MEVTGHSQLQRLSTPPEAQATETRRDGLDREHFCAAKEPSVRGKRHPGNQRTFANHVSAKGPTPAADGTRTTQPPRREPDLKNSQRTGTDISLRKTHPWPTARGRQATSLLVREVQDAPPSRISATETEQTGKQCRGGRERLGPWARLVTVQNGAPSHCGHNADVPTKNPTQTGSPSGATSPASGGVPGEDDRPGPGEPVAPHARCSGTRRPGEEAARGRCPMDARAEDTGRGCKMERCPALHKKEPFSTPRHGAGTRRTRCGRNEPATSSRLLCVASETARPPEPEGGRVVARGREQGKGGC